MSLRQRGLSLVELMIALAMGLMILGSLTAVFVTSTKVRQENDRFAEQIENGRIAVDLMGQDLRTTGFWDALDVTQLNPPASLPDPCTTSSDLATLSRLSRCISRAMTTAAVHSPASAMSAAERM